MNNLKFLLPLIVAISMCGCTLHEHKYVEEIIKEAECEKEGLIKYTCRCGDSYEETIPAKGHEFGEYIYDDNATFIKDGTETAKCVNCGTKDTRTADGTQLGQVILNMNAVMYTSHGANAQTEDGTKRIFPMHQALYVSGVTIDGYYRFEDSGVTYYVPAEDLILSASKDASSYRVISDFSELKEYDGFNYEWMLTHFLELEKVVYKTAGYSLVMYDYRWNSEWGTEMLLYDFDGDGGLRPWWITDARSIDSLVTLGGMEYFHEDPYTLERTQLYKSIEDFCAE